MKVLTSIQERARARYLKRKEENPNFMRDEYIARQLKLNPSYVYKEKKPKKVPDAQKRKDVIKKSKLKKFGLTIEKYTELLRDQNGICALCFLPFSETEYPLKSCIDHCHTTGKVRGILHMRCNNMLGNAYDKISTLEGAIAYLNSKEPKNVDS